MEYGIVAKYWAPKTRANPISTDHCIRRSMRSWAAHFTMVPAAIPKPIYAAHGKKGKWPRPDPAARYSRSRAGAPFHGRLATIGENAAMASPAAMAKRVRLLVLNTAAM